MVDKAVSGWVNFPSKCLQITPLKKKKRWFCSQSFISNLCSLAALSWNLIGTHFEMPGGTVGGGRASASTIQKTFAFVGGELLINPRYLCRFFNQSKEERPSKSHPHWGLNLRPSNNKIWISKFYSDPVAQLRPLSVVKLRHIDVFHIFSNALITHTLLEVSICSCWCFWTHLD